MACPTAKHHVIACPHNTATTLPCSWAQVANVLFLESPAGVGFSTCDSSINCTHTDESTADDSADFFRIFFEHYPELRHHDVYLTGESYAGAALRRVSACAQRSTCTAMQTRARLWHMLSSSKWVHSMLCHEST